jgi:ferredoxin
MANPNDRFSENVPGPWYVDTNCISCGLCDDALPTVFRRSIEGDQNYVHRQPESAQECEIAEEARDSCPVDAIGNDGAPEQL